MLSYLLASQDWLNGETDPVLDEILSICSQLEINPLDERLWSDLDLCGRELAGQR
ncbi:hypothetical protein JOE65_002830 [Arthrobacter roseus]|nr:hypothetical protein [Arthrobacter roseus]